MRAVLDASALMALMLGERGGDTVKGVVRGALISTVNVSECCSRGVERGASAEEVLGLIRLFEVEIVAFDLALALEAARLREPTRRLGASLGDRACMALASLRRLPLFTSDQRLGDVDPAMGLDIRLIR